jgi:FixJ family two-component response regulator
MNMNLDSKTTKHASNGRKSRAKLHANWEKVVHDSNGVHDETAKLIKSVYPDLTRSERMVLVLILDDKLSYEIKYILGIEEKTVNNHRYEVRKKIKCPHEMTLPEFIESTQKQILPQNRI